MTIIDGKTYPDWTDCVAMLVRGINPAAYIHLERDETLSLENRVMRSLVLVANRGSFAREILSTYSAGGDIERMQKIFDGLIRKQAHQGCEEIRQWALQTVLDIDATGEYPWRKIQ